VAVSWLDVVHSVLVLDSCHNCAFVCEARKSFSASVRTVLTICIHLPLALQCSI
jgi:hypothetical protein